MTTIVIAALIITVVGEAALIGYLRDQVVRMKEDPFDRDWMDYRKWRKSR